MESMQGCRLSQGLLSALAAVSLAVSLVVLPLPAVAQVTAEWVAFYDGPRHNTDEARGIAVDSEGCAYVTARSYGGDGGDVGSSGASPGSGWDFVTVKYGADGQQLWVDRYCGIGATDSNDQPWAITVDSEDNVLVTGASGGTEREWDFTTIKYSSDGARLWVARSDGLGNGQDKAVALAVNEVGDVLVTGPSRGLGSYADYMTIKYDKSGHELWRARYAHSSNSADLPQDIAVAPDGGVYVTGYVDSYGDHDGATVKYSRDGVQEWVTFYNGPADGWDTPWDIAVDAAGNAYVSGWSDGAGGGPDYLTAKYSPDGGEQWVRRYDGSPYYNSDYAHDLAVDAAGNAYVTGHCCISYGNGYDCVTVKYDTDGNEEWVSSYGGSGNGLFGDIGYSVAVDCLGNVYVTGRNDGYSNDDCATVKYDPDGTELWAVLYDDPQAGESAGRVLTLDSCGDVYVVGSRDGSGTSLDLLTIKYSDGTGVAPQDTLTAVAHLHPATPNPFTLETALRVELRDPHAPVAVDVFTATGRLVKHLYAGSARSCDSLVKWDGTSCDGVAVSSGIYFVRLTAGAESHSRKIVLLR